MGWRVVAAWVAAVVALALAGCSASSPAEAGALSGRTPTPIMGGQTGSLVPRCGVAAVADSLAQAPEGDVAYVVYTEGCPDALATGAFGLRDGNLDDVELQFEPIGDGVYAARAPSGLNAGQYSVVAPSNTTSAGATLEVTAARDLPVTLGTLRQVGVSCGVSEWELELSDEALAYAPLTQLTVRVDSLPELVWVEYGELDVVDGKVSLDIASCAWSPCLVTGTHSLVVEAEIAGEIAAPEPLVTQLQLDCSRTASDDSSFLCFLGHRAQSHSTPARAALASLMLIAVVAWRRRRLGQ